MHEGKRGGNRTDFYDWKKKVEKRPCARIEKALCDAESLD